MTICIDSEPMRVEVRQLPPGEIDADLLVVGLYEGEALPAELAGAAGAGDAKGDFQKLALLHPERPVRVLVVGLGKRDEVDAERIRLAAAVAAKQAGKLEAASLAWLLPESDETRRPLTRSSPGRSSPTTASTG